MPEEKKQAVSNVSDIINSSIERGADATPLKRLETIISGAAAGDSKPSPEDSQLTLEEATASPVLGVDFSEKDEEKGLVPNTPIEKEVNKTWENFQKTNPKMASRLTKELYDLGWRKNSKEMFCDAPSPDNFKPYSWGQYKTNPESIPLVDGSGNPFPSTGEGAALKRWQMVDRVSDPTKLPTPPPGAYWYKMNSDQQDKRWILVPSTPTSALKGGDNDALAKSQVSFRVRTSGGKFQGWSLGLPKGVKTPASTYYMRDSIEENKDPAASPPMFWEAPWAGSEYSERQYDTPEKRANINYSATLKGGLKHYTEEQLEHMRFNGSTDWAKKLQYRMGSRPDAGAFSRFGLTKKDGSSPIFVKGTVENNQSNQSKRQNAVAMPLLTWNKA